VPGPITTDRSKAAEDRWRQLRCQRILRPFLSVRLSNAFNEETARSTARVLRHVASAKTGGAKASLEVCIASEFKITSITAAGH
jgi:serine acetyltransferase